MVLAHRGDWLETEAAEPQNSIGAVLSALKAGADGAEVDARLSADGTIVLHHDPSIGPADAAAGCRAAPAAPVCSLPDAALGHLATLAGVLDALDLRAQQTPAHSPGRVLLNIELKDLPGEPGWQSEYGLARRVAELLASRPHRHGLDVVVSSFDPGSLAQFGLWSPATAIALLVDEGEDWRRHLERHFDGDRSLSGINPADALATPELFSDASSRGLAVVPWTIDSVGRALELAALGAAGVITNRPRAVLQALMAETALES